MRESHASLAASFRGTVAASLPETRSAAALVMNAVPVLIDEAIAIALALMLPGLSFPVAAAFPSQTIVDPVAVFIDECGLSRRLLSRRLLSCGLLSCGLLSCGLLSLPAFFCGALPRLVLCREGRGEKREC
jgi:hypothetical protein